MRTHEAAHSIPAVNADAQKLPVRRIVGQMTAIERMLRRWKRTAICAEILMQLVSARKAIKVRSPENLIHSYMRHMRHCEHAHSPTRGRTQAFAGASWWCWSAGYVVE